MVEFNLSNDIIFDNIVEHITNKTNNSYECKILKEEMNDSLNLKFIELMLEDEKSQNFIMLPFN